MGTHTMGMARGAPEPPPLLFLQSLCQHVCAPLASADERLEYERGVTTAELDAFEAFTERLETIDALETTAASGLTTPTAVRGSRGGRPGRPGGADGMERVRTAYRETVMDVDHYDAVYGESFDAHIAGEFGTDVAAVVRSDTSMGLTRPVKNTIVEAANRAIRERRSFGETLAEEAASIERAHTALTDRIGALDTTSVPDWHREAFTEQLDRIAEERQNTLRSHQSCSRLDAHSLCGYLYKSEPWNYPVLTAVGRLREALVL